MKQSKVVKIAFFGDQGIKPAAEAVLWMIKDWNPDAVIHLGDFDYKDDPHGFDDQINGILGYSFPYLGLVGNHDVDKWPEYQEKLESRLIRSDLSSKCYGDYGVNMFCDIHGVSVVLSGVGTLGSQHLEFLEKTLSEDKAKFKICSWHKNQHDYQPGDKPDEIGWGAYETCLKYGAMITSGHTHSYGRTHLMKSYDKHQLESTESVMKLKRNTSFAAIVGTGGIGISDFPNGQMPTEDWWAALAAKSTDLTYGALLCSFYIEEEPGYAKCEFKDIKGRIWDMFEMKSFINA